MVLGNCLLGMVALCHYCYDLCKDEANMTVGFRYLLVQHKEQTIYPVSLAMWHIWCSNKLSLRISIFSRVFIYSINCIYFFLHHMFEISDKLVHDFRNVIIFTYSFKENFIWYQHFFCIFSWVPVKFNYTSEGFLGLIQDSKVWIRKLNLYYRSTV